MVDTRVNRFGVSGKNERVFAGWIDTADGKGPSVRGGFKHVGLGEGYLAKQPAFPCVKLVLPNPVGQVFLQGGKQQQCPVTLLNCPRLDDMRGNASRLTVHCGHGAAVRLARLFYHGDAVNHWRSQWNDGKRKRRQTEHSESSKHPKDDTVGFSAETRTQH